MDTFVNTFAMVHQWVFESLVQPVVFALGLGGWLEIAFKGSVLPLVGLLQILVMVCLIRPLERWRPVEAISDRATIYTDMLYTVVHRMGLFRLGLFFTLDPLFDEFFGTLRAQGVGTLHLDQILPGVTDLPWVSLVLYVVALDFVDYWIHRGQHHFGWWWKLHSTHHAQRQMTMWSDNRNHLLDDMLRDSIFVLVAQSIGVAPGQFIAITALVQLSESLQHANFRLDFGGLMERIWISPQFHRLHHSIGIGHEGQGPLTLGGHNFGVLLPWWDRMFYTGVFDRRYDRTGVRDQVEKGRDYGSGFWSQQKQGLLRLLDKA